MTEPAPKGKAVPVKRKGAKTTKPGEDLTEANVPATRTTVNAARLAQIVNLHIAGFSLEAIGNSIGCSADEVDRILTNDVARYVRSQPALRVYVRNYISEKYGKMLKAIEDDATNKTSPKKLESQDRMLRILAQMSKLHGADAPVQTEVKVEAAPETVEAMVKFLAEKQGLGYDDDVFDADIVEEIVHESELELEAASAAVEEPQPGDEDDILTGQVEVSGNEEAE